MSVQAEFWAGKDGDEYTARNHPNERSIAHRTRLWAEILSHTQHAPPHSILEFGANVGGNLQAISRISDANLFGVEPNESAFKKLSALPCVRQAWNTTIDGFGSGWIDAELAFTCGVLIHVHPNDLCNAIAKIHRSSSEWIACAEYFSPRSESVEYRGHNDILFRRDFGSMWLDTFPDLECVAYGFAWKRQTGLDNLTWWLFRKRIGWR